MNKFKYNLYTNGNDRATLKTNDIQVLNRFIEIIINDVKNYVVKED